MDLQTSSQTISKSDWYNQALKAFISLKQEENPCYSQINVVFDCPMFSNESDVAFLSEISPLDYAKYIFEKDEENLFNLAQKRLEKEEKKLRKSFKSLGK